MRTLTKPWIRTTGACALVLAGSLTLSGCNLTGSDDGDRDPGTTQEQNDSGDDSRTDDQDDSADDGQDDSADDDRDADGRDDRDN